MAQVVYKFVEFGKGVYEGHEFNNVTLSNGVRAVKFKNKTGSDELLATLKEGDEVVPEFNIEFGRDSAIVTLVAITKTKKEK